MLKSFEIHVLGIAEFLVRGQTDTLYYPLSIHVCMGLNVQWQSGYITRFLLIKFCMKNHQFLMGLLMPVVVLELA